MSVGMSVLWSVVVLGAGYGLWRLHRLCLWMEERGWLYYKYKRASSSAAGSFVAVQQMIEPQTRHVIEVQDEKREQNENEIPGAGDLQSLSRIRFQSE